MIVIDFLLFITKNSMNVSFLDDVCLCHITQI